VSENRGGYDGDNMTIIGRPEEQGSRLSEHALRRSKHGLSVLRRGKTKVCFVFAGVRVYNHRIWRDMETVFPLFGDLWCAQAPADPAPA
jgi:hypothetical protein